MNSDVIKAIAKAGESEHLALTRLTPLSTIGSTLCAFLNSGGGTIIAGTFKDGTAVHKKLPEGAFNGLRTTLQDKLSPFALFSVREEQFTDGEVIYIDAPSGKDLPYVYDGKIYVRAGTQTREADASDIRRLVQARATEAVRWERRISSGLEISDLDQNQIVRTSAAAEKLNLTPTITAPLPSGSSGIMVSDLLDMLALRQYGELTNGAEVLFSKNPALRLPQTRIRVVRFENDKGGNFILDRVLAGNAFDLFEQAFDLIHQNVKISAHFIQNKAQREIVPAYPFAALREGLINAIIHRDYEAYTGGISIGIYPGRIEIWNSGQLPKGMSIDDLLERHPSLPNNPDMTHLFYLRGYIERIGRGTQKILEECRAADLQTPSWKVDATGVTLTFYGRRTGRTSVSPSLSGPPASNLRAIRTGIGISQLQLAEYIGISEKTIGRIERGHTPNLATRTKILKALNEMGSEPHTIEEVFPLNKDDSESA